MLRYPPPAGDYHRQNVNGPQSRQRALPPPTHQSRVAAFNYSGSPSGPYSATAAPTSHAELPTHDFDDHDYPGDWDYYYDSYEPVHETDD